MHIKSINGLSSIILVLYQNNKIKLIVFLYGDFAEKAVPVYTLLK